MTLTAQAELGPAPGKATLDRDGLPESIIGASEEHQQRFFLKLMLESVLESKSPVLDFTVLLQKYAVLSGQAHKRCILLAVSCDAMHLCICSRFLDGPISALQAAAD